MTFDERSRRAARACLLLATSVLTATTSARAQETAPDSPPARPFGHGGQVVLSSTGSSLAAWAGVAISTPFVTIGAVNTSGSSAKTVVLINPGLDVFVADHISLGGELLVGAAYGGGARDTRYAGASLRLGVQLALGTGASFWPRIHASYESSSSGATSVDFEMVTLDLPVLWHASPSFFIGFGPSISATTLTPSTTILRFVTLTMGGAL